MRRLNKFRLTGKKVILASAAVAVILFLMLLLLMPAGACLDDFTFSTAVLDRNGEMLRIFLTEDEKYRIREPLAGFSPQFIEMILLKEDRYFYSHPGVNPAALVKAAWSTYVSKDYRMGASTITMQLARLKYHLHTTRIPGKIDQIFKAFYLEIKYSKQEILEAYMNLAPCGDNIEGFPAAAYYYYHKNLGELTLSEMFFLAVLPQAPNARAPQPGHVPAESLEARSLLYSDWLKEHPEDAEYSAQMDMPVSFYCSFPFKAPHAADYVKALTPAEQGPPGEALSSMISTSLDLHYQELVERHVENYLRSKRSIGVNNSSVLLLDFSTMEVLAAVGSADFFDDGIEGQVNGFTAKRSPGSTLKPFIYAMAIEQGIIHPDSMLKDTPTSYGVYTPDNYQSDFKGPVKAWEALVHSRNIPAINLAVEIENPDLYDFLINAGVTGLKDRGYYGLSIVLGSAEVTMLELVSMYAALGNEGLQYPLQFLKETPVEPVEKRLLSMESSILTLRMLQKNPEPTEHRPARARSVPVAYKTGTSIGFKDCWSVGIFDRYVICVWIGNFNGDGNPAFLGRNTAAPLLFSIADSIILEIPAEKKYRPMMPPNTISQVEVCSVSGCIPNDSCPDTIMTDFIPGVSPITRCRIHREVFIDTATGYRTARIGDPGVIKTVREFWSSDMLRQFKLAGLPRITPPPMEPENNSRNQISEGSPPMIISPLTGGTYIIRRTRTRNNSIPLVAVADADTTTLFWFSDNNFIGKTARDGRLEWFPKEGEYSLTVLDDIGRSDTVMVIIESAQ
ncbi:MAG: penicillin-binding protein 1C [Spirochaetales bacterium]|nr:penicillin-binding protein 1C [Spirochaetales bacterium]